MERPIYLISVAIRSMDLRRSISDPVTATGPRSNFGTKTQSCVQRGKMKVEEDDGNKTDFYFSENGRGYTGVKDNYLYYKGKLQKATDGQKYVCYKIDSSNYVVNSSGKVMEKLYCKDQ